MRDPLQHGILLPLEGRYYPLGFPLSVRSNCAAVLESVRSSWGDVPPAYSKPLLELHVVVEPGGMPPPPVFRAQRNLMIIAADPHNFAVCDRRGNFAFVNLRSGAFADPEFVRGQFLEAAVFHLLTQSCVTPVHAACVESGGRGILLCGDSGAGKSCLAYTCARAGFTYISDNESWLLRPEECAVVAGDPRRIRFRDTAAELFGELRGRQSYVTPGGKRSVDLPVVGFQGIRRAFRANIAALVWLRR
ncbi:MAG: aldolase, partial [Acidobacteria bacterium]|nr:aldolase [Acidobacteriota bacterium]